MATLLEELLREIAPRTLELSFEHGYFVLRWPSLAGEPCSITGEATTPAMLESLVRWSLQAAKREREARKGPAFG